MKKVLFLGFTAVQLELARKFVIYRSMAGEVELLSEQHSSTPVDGYVVNGDDPSVPARLGLYLRAYPRPVLGIGGRAILGTTTYVAGPFKPATVDRLMQMLQGTPEAAGTAAANVVSFPGATAVPNADVLVVDDSDLVRKTMARKINQYGHRVDVANGGDDAMAMLMNNSYKLVFLDVMMPGMDGFEVCRRIKRSTEFKVSAVYMLTSKDGMFDKVRGSMAGCDGYLVKPLESRKLREVLDKYFDRPSLVGDSDLISSRAGTAEFNEAERRAIEGLPTKVAANGAKPSGQAEYQPSFAPTLPSQSAQKSQSS